MKIFCLGDLHLSGDPPFKPMDIFGEHWRGHREKIARHWRQTVSEQDYVIVCGDISWASKLAGASADLQWLEQLPGHKILLRGNHDQWWSSLTKMQDQYPNLAFLQNNCIMLGKTAVCGSRGWKLPSNFDFTAEDKKIYQRELARLELSLQAAKKKGAREIIVALHYPPLFRRYENNGFTRLFHKYGVHQVVFGHLHGKPVKRSFWSTLLWEFLGWLPLVRHWLAPKPGEIRLFEGKKQGTAYKLCSADTQNFTPVFIKKI